MMTSPKPSGGEANRSTPRVSLSPPMGSTTPPNTSLTDSLPDRNDTSTIAAIDIISTQDDSAASANSGSLHSSYKITSQLDRTDDNTVDPRFVLPKCPLPQRNEMEPIAVFVANAVREQSAQQDMVQNYLVILDAFRYKKDLPMLVKLLIALRTAGPTLSLLASDATKHARLIHSIVRFSPFPPETVESTNAVGASTTTDDEDVNAPESNPFSEEFDTSLADAQFHFLVALLSANSTFLIPALTALWKLLTFQISNAHPQRTLRIHAALATICRLVPKAKTELLPIISSHTPFRMRSQAELVYYYEQCLYVLEYLPQLRGPIIELMVSRCLELDMEIKITDHGDATVDVAASSNTADGELFQLDLEDNNHEADELLNSNVTVDVMADKLDSLLFTLFQYIEHAVDTGIGSPLDVFKTLSCAFESAILITHKSKFVQFLILHVCGLESRRDELHSDSDSSLYRDFASLLIEIVLDPYRATVTRQTAACYLASFVSRASFVCAETVCETINALLRWAEAYMQSLGGSNSSIFAPDARDQCHMHSLFYTVCQSAFYIMCFRGLEAVRFCRISDDTNPPSIDLGCARWTNLCSHPLLPLRYCLESVRTEFLRISKVFSIMDDTVLNRLLNDEVNGQNQALKKKRNSFIILTPATLEKERLRGGVGGLGRGTNPLDSFFPFDPYLLRRSYCYIEPFYNHWDGGVSDDAENDEEVDEGTMAVVVDSDSDDDSTRQPQSDGDDVADSDSDDDDETETVPVEVVRRKRLMSVASNATSISSRHSSVDDRGVGPLTAKRLEMKKAWSAVVKRPRAPSCSENGSW
jgi:RNA polymerase I-specific transcription initiation factor RRN3